MSQFELDSAGLDRTIDHMLLHMAGHESRDEARAAGARLRPREAISAFGDPEPAPRNDAARVAWLAADASLRARCSQENRTTAERFSERALAPRRERFYEAVRGAVTVPAT